MIAKYDKDSFIDVDSIKAIYKTEDQNGIWYGFVLMNGVKIILPMDIFDRVLDAYWQFNKHLAYDFTDKESEGYKGKVKGDL